MIDLQISDFGSAKYFEVTRQTSISITYAWSAPEVRNLLQYSLFDLYVFYSFSRKSSLNLSCDVYSYGVVLWEMLTHMEPYADLDNLQILFAVSAGEVHL